MDFINIDQIAEITNDNARALIEALVDAAQDFEDRRKGAYFRGIVIGIAQTYPEDNAAIQGVFRELSKRSAKKEVDNEPRAKLSKGGGGRNTGEDCDGCPGNSKQVTHARNLSAMKNLKMEAKLRKGKSAKPPTEGSKESSGANASNASENPDPVQALLEKFGGNANVLKSYAQREDITIPASVKKPETIAKYIVEGLAKKEEEQ